MPADTLSHTDSKFDAELPSIPEIAVCESRPGNMVFTESGNTDGWIASDHTVDVVR